MQILLHKMSQQPMTQNTITQQGVTQVTTRRSASPRTLREDGSSAAPRAPVCFAEQAWGMGVGGWVLMDGWVGGCRWDEWIREKRLARLASPGESAIPGKPRRRRPAS